MIRVLFVFNTPVTGGAERHTFILSDQLAGYGIEAAIFAMKAGPAQAHGQTMMLQPQKPRHLPGRIADLASVIRDLKPDALVAVNERPVLATFAARSLARAAMPIVAISHSTILRNRREELMQIGYTPIFNRIESVVFISANQRRYWAKRGVKPRHATTILNGVDVRRFSPSIRVMQRTSVRASLGFQPDDLVLGLCAVMRPEKNHGQLLQAVAQLRRQGLPVKALLVGDGPSRTEIEQRARALEITPFVVFAGMRDDVRPLVAAFDVGVLCSVSIETLSLSALEVMAMGIPMVMSDIGGASEIVDGANGRLFPAGDDAALCQAILAFGDARVRAASGAAARLKVEHTFDQAVMIQSYARHLTGVVSGHYDVDENLSSSQGMS